MAEREVKQYVIGEATKKRCKIIDADAATIKRISKLNLELYHFLYEVQEIDFSIYFRVENKLIEFIKPNELSRELLQRLHAASMHDECDVEVCLLKADIPKFEHAIGKVRDDRIKKLVQNNPELDQSTLSIFTSLSAASQMIVRGGINRSVATRVKAAATHMMDNILDNDVSASTLSRMITIDPTLYDHSASVAMFAGVLAGRFMKKPLSESETKVVIQAGLYHDTGKTCVPNAILNKPGKLTDDEFEIMESHALLGYEELQKAITQGAAIDGLVARVALEHHERFKGAGYPHKKSGRYEDDPENGIHLYSRIVSIADVYSALLMKRVYKPAWDSDKALGIMKENADRDYDPEIFQAFVTGVTKSFVELETKAKSCAHSRIVIVGEDDSFQKAVLEQQRREQRKKPA